MDEIGGEPALAFADVAAFRDWLAANHGTAKALWLKFYKKGSGTPTIAKTDAIDEALCWGWVDGQLGKGDESFFLTRFTPRKPNSRWSKVNTGRVERMIASGRMQPPGLAEVSAAKADGRWDDAYAAQSEAELPDDLKAAIAADPAAAATLPRLKRIDLFTLYYRVTTAKKPETRAVRIGKIVEKLAAGETVFASRPL